MSKKFSWLKNNLMGSTTMPAGTGGGLSFLQTGHIHKEDGSCCGHDHHHHEAHEHTDACGHDHVHGAHCDHDHNHDDEDCTSPKGGCC